MLSTGCLGREDHHCGGRDRQRQHRDLEKGVLASAASSSTTTPTNRNLARCTGKLRYRRGDAGQREEDRASATRPRQRHRARRSIKPTPPAGCASISPMKNVKPSRRITPIGLFLVFDALKKPKAMLRKSRGTKSAGCWQRTRSSVARRSRADHGRQFIVEAHQVGVAVTRGSAAGDLFSRLLGNRGGTPLTTVLVYASSSRGDSS